MGYRDDRAALELEVADLQRENTALRSEVATLRETREQEAVERRHTRRGEARTHCLACGGSLLPVAVFAGHDHEHPLPLSASTARFGGKHGGFTHAAHVQALACSTCGLVHHFLPIDEAQGEGAGDLDSSH